MINLQLIKNFFVIIVAIFIIAILFVPKNKSVSQEKFAGEIYNRSTSKLLEKKESPNLKETEPIKKENIEPQQPTLTKFTFYTSINTIPSEFIAIKTNLTDANFVIVSTDNILKKENKSKKPQVHKTAKPQIDKTKIKNIDNNIITQKPIEISTNTQTNRTDIKEEDFSYSILNDIIKNNLKTYFYADNFKNSSDVAVGIYSITPYKEYHILKFQVKNNSTSYFFIGNVEIKRTSKLIICKKYFDSIVAKNKTLEGIILAPEFSKNDKVKFKLYESGNKNRAYEIIIKIP